MIPVGLKLARTYTNAGNGNNSTRHLDDGNRGVDAACLCLKAGEAHRENYEPLRNDSTWSKQKDAIGPLKGVARLGESISPSPLSSTGDR